MTTRRTFLKFAGLSVGAVVVGPKFDAFATETRPLMDGVSAACRRLAPLGWGQMLKDATGGQLDIAAADLKGELSKPLAIDRAYPGFGDFAASATRAIEPGNPDRSLLYHAFAAPTVVADKSGAELGGFPTLAEIDALENYVYGVEPPDPRCSAGARQRDVAGAQGRRDAAKARHRGVRPAISQHADVRAWAPCRTLLRAFRRRPAGNNRPAVRCASAQFCVVGSRRSHSNFASCRVVSPCILRRSSRVEAGSDLKTR